MSEAPPIALDETLARWQALLDRLGVASHQAKEEGVILWSCYEEEWRAYHGLRHLMDCLNAWEELLGQFRQAEVVCLALWFHDVVYDPKRNDNEERSAEMARAFCLRHGLEGIADRVVELILLTRHHLAPIGDEDAALLCDIDLSILGAGLARFAAYETAIGREYDWVPPNAFREGRSKVLRRFLDRAGIYASSRFREPLEAPARENLARSLARLHGGAIGEAVGTLVPGHQVASGGGGNPAYPGGTLRMQAPHFAERGLDVSGCYPGTLNVSLVPWTLALREPRHTFRRVRWHPVDPPEDFSFVDCAVTPVDGAGEALGAPHPALVYHPHPETKPKHHQPSGLVEILAPHLSGIVYGGRLRVALEPAQAVFLPPA